jgi:hypothetical protein
VPPFFPCFHGKNEQIAFFVEMKLVQALRICNYHTAEEGKNKNKWGEKRA